MTNATTESEKENTMTDETGPRYPDCIVELTGHDGNAFAILGTVQKALRRGGVPAHLRIDFRDEATSGDYDHLLQTCMKWVTVE